MGNITAYKEESVLLTFNMQYGIYYHHYVQYVYTYFDELLL